MLLPVHAYKKVEHELSKRVNRKPKCVVDSRQSLSSIDAYTRQRLRIALKHKRPKRRDAYCNSFKYDLQFFASMGLVSGEYMHHVAIGGTLSLAEFMARRSTFSAERNKKYIKKRYTDRGIVYYNKERLAAIQACYLRAQKS